MLRRSSAMLALITVSVATTAMSSADQPEPRRVRARLAAINEPVETARLVAPRPSDGDELGRSVAIDRDVIVVGAPGNVTDPGAESAGAAHVFLLDGAAWRHAQRLVAYDHEPSDSFGRAAAVSAGTIAVGAEHDVIDGRAAAGSVYIFVREGARWSLEQKLSSPDPRPEGHFGHSLALHGNTLAVGTWATDTVYVFNRTDAQWSEPQVIRAEPGEGGNFGSSIALDGDSMVIGAEWRWDPVHSTSGGASVYTRLDDEWTFDQALTAADATANDRFGTSVAIDGDVIAVGAPEDDSDVYDDRGAAYVFRRGDDGWVEEQKLLPCVEQPWLRFGWSVATARDVILIGAPGEAVRDLSRAGCVHLFRRSGQSWAPSCLLAASEAASSDELGEVAFSGHTAVFGARLADVGDSLDAGAAYVFLIP